MGVTRDQIRTAFICLLNREPESEETYNYHSVWKDVGALRQCIVRGAEYQNRMLKIRAAHQRDALFYIHLEKTGGTSLFTTLMRNYAPEQIAPSHYGFQDDFDLIESTYDFFSGHFDYQAISVVPRRTKKLVSLFRRPIDRMISKYRYSRAHPVTDSSDDDHAFLARKLSPEEFFAHPAVRCSPLINNYYLRIFSSSASQKIRANWSVNDDSGLLAIAKSRILSLDAIGLTHRMKESIFLICSALGFPVPDTIEVLNRTDSLPREDTMFVEAPPVVPTQALKDVVRDLIHYDEILFDVACREFQKRLSQMMAAPLAPISGTP